MTKLLKEILSELKEINSKLSVSELRNDVLTVKEVANLLNYETGTVYIKAAKGEIPSFKRGRDRLFNRSDIEEILNPSGDIQEPEPQETEKTETPFPRPQPHPSQV